MFGRPFYAFVDSDWSISGNTGDFNYIIDLPASHDFDSVVLLQGSFPKTYYVVRQGFNMFSLTEGVDTVTITMPAGNYGALAFRASLQAELNANSPHGFVYSVTQPTLAIGASTGKFTYAVSNNSGIQPSFTFPTISLLYHQMGFNYNSTNAFVSDVMISTNVIDFNTVKGLLVKSDCVEGEYISSPTGSSMLQEVLCFNTSDFSNIGFANPAPEYSAKRLKRGTGKLFNFKITDLDDNILDFNGQSCNFSLAFFKRDNYNEMAARDMKMKYYQDLIAPKQPVLPTQPAQPVLPTQPTQQTQPDQKTQ